MENRMLITGQLPLKPKCILIKLKTSKKTKTILYIRAKISSISTVCSKAESQMSQYKNITIGYLEMWTIPTLLIKSRQIKPVRKRP